MSAIDRWLLRPPRYCASKWRLSSSNSDRLRAGAGAASARPRGDRPLANDAPARPSRPRSTPRRATCREGAPGGDCDERGFMIGLSALPGSRIHVHRPRRRLNDTPGQPEASTGRLENQLMPVGCRPGRHRPAWPQGSGMCRLSSRSCSKRPGVALRDRRRVVRSGRAARAFGNRGVGVPVGDRTPSAGWSKRRRGWPAAIGSARRRGCATTGATAAEIAGASRIARRSIARR